MLDLPLQAVHLGLRRITVAEYQQLTVAGFFAKDERFELLDGLIVRRPTFRPPHAATYNRVRKRLDREVPAGWYVYCRPGVALEVSVPEPDLCVLRELDEEYQTRLPTANDLGIVIDVTDAGLLTVKRDKLRIYAAGRVPVRWLVNIPERQIEVYTDPQPTADPPAYATVRVFPRGQDVPLELDGVAVAAVPVGDQLL